MTDQRYPFFSVIVPTYNRPAQLLACLESLKRLEYPREDFEVIVVDDGSQTPLQEKVALFRTQLNITLITQEHSGPAMARNRGTTKAKGPFLAFTDDDCTPAPDWLRTLGARFDRTPDRMIGGQTFNIVSDNFYSEVSYLLIEYLYSYYNADSKRARFFTSNNFALPADHFHTINGFNPSFPRAAGEDREFCERWLGHGYWMTYAPEVQVYHRHALSLSTFCRQHFSYGRGAFHFHKIRTRDPSGSFRTEPLSFYLNMLNYPFSSKRNRFAFLFSALLFVTQMANASGFLWEWMKQKRKRFGQPG
jgi:glycosyltransferase involved in cell wall biosynthesis